MRKRPLSLALLALAALLAAGRNASADLIVNGDFSAGSAGFTSGYIEDSSAGAGMNAGPLQGGGYYGIVTSSQFWHPSFDNFGDHTTGTGNMMIVNADNLGATTVWSEDALNVIPGATYRLEFWARSAYPVSPATLQISATVNALSQEFDLAGDTSAWQHFSVDFVAPVSPTTVKIIDTNTQLSGNDFALDDISLNQIRQAIPEAPSAVPVPASAWGGGLLLAVIGLTKKFRGRLA